MAELCGSLREDEAYLQNAARDILKAEDGDGVSLSRLLSQPPALSGRVLALLFGEPPISRTNREEILTLARRGAPHSSLDLPDGRRARIENGRLIAAHAEEEPPCPLPPTPVGLGATELVGRKMLLVIDSEQNPNESRLSAKNIYKNETTIYINSDRIKNGLFVRSRKEGDTLLCHGMHKKLRKLQNECALALPLRTALPLLCDSDGILWCPQVALRDGATGDALLRVTLFY
jgi:tRNA(Ile)-lysidine synthetase-like protein